jgi:hypothetical protein
MNLHLKLQIENAKHEKAPVRKFFFREEKQRKLYKRERNEKKMSFVFIFLREV